MRTFFIASSRAICVDQVLLLLHAMVMERWVQQRTALSRTDDLLRHSGLLKFVDVVTVLLDDGVQTVSIHSMVLVSVLFGIGLGTGEQRITRRELLVRRASVFGVLITTDLDCLESHGRQIYRLVYIIQIYFLAVGT